MMLPPTSAADIYALYPRAQDGEYDIWLNGDKDKQVRLFCRMSGGNPREYLVLPGTNNSQVAHNFR